MSSDAHWEIAEQAAEAAKKLAGIEEGVAALVENMHAPQLEAARQTVAMLAVKAYDETGNWETAVQTAVAVYRDIQGFDLWD